MFLSIIWNQGYFALLDHLAIQRDVFELMNFPPLVFTALILVFSAGCATSQNRNPIPQPGGVQRIQLPPADAAAIGRRIWKNECGGTVEGLTSWNTGEDFASLGIGHFIWYVSGRRGPFDESFPKLITYAKARQVPVPSWLAVARGCPWANRDAFLAARNSAQMQELRKFLAENVALQTDFIVLRLEQALPKMLAATSGKADQLRLQSNFYKVAQSRSGVYALIDYVNFKGEGVKKEERYQGQGWGLRDVLLGMRETPGGPGSALEFSESAKRVLQRRVRNSPAQRNEARWLDGWTNRCESYKTGP